MNLVPGLSLRASEEAEIIGIDDSELGEFAYDYVEHKREIPYTPSIHGQARSTGSDSPAYGEKVNTKSDV